MKALLASVMLVAAGGMMAGCAPQPLTRADVDGKIVCNADRMDQVERKARREHLDVHWVNCPHATLRAA
jgi:hypothetical protein